MTTGRPAEECQLERTLLDQATRSVTILRPCAIHGTHSSDPREWWFVKRMLDGRPFIPSAYEGKSSIHTGAVANIAAVVLDHPASRPACQSERCRRYDRRAGPL
jgi:hypothetical protein